QGELVGPGGAGLLVFGSGLEWGTAYLGPDGRAPGSARSFIPVARPAPDAPPVPLAPVPARELGAAPAAAPEPDAGPGPAPEAGTAPAPEPVPEPVAAAPGTSLAPRRQPVLTPAPQPAGPRAISPVRVPSRELGIKAANPSYVGPKTPTDVKIVVLALVIAIIVAAVIIGMLSNSPLIAVIVAVVGLVTALGVIVFSRI